MTLDANNMMMIATVIIHVIRVDLMSAALIGTFHHHVKHTASHKMTASMDIINAIN